MRRAWGVGIRLGVARQQAFRRVQIAFVGTRLLTSLVGDLRGRRMEIATIIFRKSPCEACGAVLRLGVMAQWMTVRSHGDALPRRLGRLVFGAR